MFVTTRSLCVSFFHNAVLWRNMRSVHLTQSIPSRFIQYIVCMFACMCQLHHWGGGAFMGGESAWVCLWDLSCTVGCWDVTANVSVRWPEPSHIRAGADDLLLGETQRRSKGAQGHRVLCGQQPYSHMKTCVSAWFSVLSIESHTVWFKQFFNLFFNDCWKQTNLFFLFWNRQNYCQGQWCRIHAGCFLTDFDYAYSMLWWELYNVNHKLLIFSFNPVDLSMYTFICKFVCIRSVTMSLFWYNTSYDLLHNREISLRLLIKIQHFTD